MAQPQDELNVSEETLQYIVNSSIVDFLDQEVIVYCFSQQIVGKLIVFSSNVTVHLEHAKKVWIHDGKYAEEPLGTIIIKIEDIVFIGLTSPDMFSSLTMMPLESVKMDFIKSHSDDTAAFLS